MKKLKILIGCEESQAVTKAFRELGHEAYSCDLVPCSGGHPEWHLQMDVFDALELHEWDGVILHPTCTFLTNSGVRWLYQKDGRQNTERWFKLIEAMEFFNKLIDCCNEIGIKHFALENPIPHKYAINGIADKKGIGKYDQLIQPYQFGHLEKKATCLWLNGLPPLTHTNNMYKETMKLDYKDRAKIHYASPGPERAKLRSKTYQGIADAMATQWSNYILNK